MSVGVEPVRRGNSSAAPPSRRHLPLGRIAAAFAAVPFLLLVYDASTGNLGVDPIETIMRRTGFWTLTLLIATLAVTPVRRLTGWNRLIDIRRSLGVASFCYACLHFSNYLVLDQFFGWSFILEDIIERPFITTGFTAFLLLAPLAATSTKASIRRLGGKRWQRLHRLIYPAALLGAFHYFWAVKADRHLPLLYADPFPGQEDNQHKSRCHKMAEGVEAERRDHANRPFGHNKVEAPDQHHEKESRFGP